MRQLRRLWQYLDVVEAEVLAGEVEPLVGPGPQDDLDGLAKARRALFRRDAKCGELDPGKAAPRTPIDPPAREQIEQRHLLGEAQRMVEQRERHRRPDPQPRCARCGQCPDHVHRGTDAEAAEVMLGEPDRVVTGPVHDLDPLQCAGVDCRQIDPPLRPAKELQNTQLHFSPASTSRQKSTAARAQRPGCSRLTPWPLPANSSSRPRGKLAASIFCCSEAIRLLSPLSSSTGMLIPGSSGFTSIASKHSCNEAAMSGRVLSISAMHHSRSGSGACSMSSR